jgi:hypothetical protein
MVGKMATDRRRPSEPGIAGRFKRLGMESIMGKTLEIGTAFHAGRRAVILEGFLAPGPLAGEAGRPIHDWRLQGYARPATQLGICFKGPIPQGQARKVWEIALIMPSGLANES